MFGSLCINEFLVLTYKLINKQATHFRLTLYKIEYRRPKSLCPHWDSNRGPLRPSRGSKQWLRSLGYLGKFEISVIHFHLNWSPVFLWICENVEYIQVILKSFKLGWNIVFAPKSFCLSFIFVKSLFMFHSAKTGLYLRNGLFCKSSNDLLTLQCFLLLVLFFPLTPGHFLFSIQLDRKTRQALSLWVKQKSANERHWPRHENVQTLIRG